MAQLIQNGDVLSGTSNDSANIMYSEPDGSSKNIQEKIEELNNSLTNLPTAILSTGSTSVTITDTRIKADGLIDIYTDVYGVNPTSVEASDGSITLNFDAQEVDVQVKVRCL